MLHYFWPAQYRVVFLFLAADTNSISCKNIVTLFTLHLVPLIKCVNRVIYIAKSSFSSPLFTITFMKNKKIKTY